MPIPFASERNLILFVVHFAFVFENDDEEEACSLLHVLSGTHTTLWLCVML